MKTNKNSEGLFSDAAVIKKLGELKSECDKFIESISPEIFDLFRVNRTLRRALELSCSDKFGVERAPGYWVGLALKEEESE